ncbi:MAG TPA: glycine cleavage system aminomethyltransferase GcvT [Allosphingosinicella sp.]|jgi:aminomethyltransferase
MSDAVESTLPLNDWHVARGARMVPFAGYAMPIQYEGIMAEHRWTRESAGLFDVSHMGQLIIAGPEAEKGLEALLPADLAILKEGRLRYSLLLAEDGGIVDDLMVTRRGDHFYTVVNGATKDGDIAYLTERLPRGVVLDHMKEQALLALQGPKAVDALARLAPGVEQLGFMTGGSFQLGGGPAWISRSGYTGEDGFEISVPAARVAEVADLLAAEPEVKPIGLGARDSLRLEAGLPLYGHDLDRGITPIEADLGFAVSKRRRGEGGFAGWYRIIREIEEGPVRRRVGLAVEGRQPVREGAAVVDADGDEVGKVTSGGFSPMLEAPIAMAYVPAGSAEPGTPVRLAQRGKIFQAKVVPMPFVPHRYHRKGAAR